MSASFTCGAIACFTAGGAILGLSEANILRSALIAAARTDPLGSFTAAINPERKPATSQKFLRVQNSWIVPTAGQQGATFVPWRSVGFARLTSFWMDSAPAECPEQRTAPAPSEVHLSPCRTDAARCNFAPSRELSSTTFDRSPTPRYMLRRIKKGGVSIQDNAAPPPTPNTFGTSQTLLPSLHYSRKWNTEEFFVRAKQRCDKVQNLVRPED